MTTLLVARVASNSRTVTIGSTTVISHVFDGILRDQLASAGESYNDIGQRDSLIAAYRDDPSIFDEDLAAYRLAHNGKMTGSELALRQQSRAIDADVIDDVEDAEANGTDPSYCYMTPGQKVHFAQVDADDREVVDCAKATLDPANALKTHSELGRVTLARLRKAKRATDRPDGTTAWNGQKDVRKQFDRIEETIRMESCIETIELDKIVRVHLLVEAIRPFAPNVDKLSYGLVHNRLLPLLVFDAETLTGEIKKGWHVWLKEFAIIQLGSKPLNKAGVTKLMAEQTAELDAERAEKLDPEKQLESEQDAIARRAARPRAAAIKAVGSAIDKTLTDGHIDASDLISILDKNLIAHGKTMPSNPGTFDPAKATIADCKMLALALSARGKNREMQALVTYLSNHLARDMEDEVSQVA
jgi:hypothetical protein